MLSTQKDHLLTTIPNLSRLPWVGSEFNYAERRLLIAEIIFFIKKTQKTV